MLPQTFCKPLTPNIYIGNLMRHALTHTDEKPYPCDLCDKAFKEKIVLKNHMKKVHHAEVNSEDIKKELSEYRSDVMASLVQGILRENVDEKEENKIPDSNMKIEAENYVEENGNNENIVCEVDLNMFDENDDDEDNDTDVGNYSKGNEQIEESVSSGENEEIDNVMLTPEINLSFDENRSIEMNDKIDTENDQNCDMFIKSEVDLPDTESDPSSQVQNESTKKFKIKIRTNTEPKQKTYKCSTCDKSFKHQCEVKRHEMIHIGVKPFACDVCGRAFTQKATLNNHKLIHTGERPFSCEVCYKTFTRKAYLTMHLRTHTGERPYSCETCGKSFISKTDLTQHYRVHTGEKPYTCDTCGKSFAQKSTLTVHEKVHTGDKPYICPLCGKSFSDKGNLVRHNMTHTGERPYACDLCHKTFAVKGILMKHRKKMHFKEDTDDFSMVAGHVLDVEQNGEGFVYEPEINFDQFSDTDDSENYLKSDYDASTAVPQNDSNENSNNSFSFVNDPPIETC